MARQRVDLRLPVDLLERVHAAREGSFTSFVELALESALTGAGGTPGRVGQGVASSVPSAPSRASEPSMSRPAQSGKALKLARQQALNKRK